MPLLYTGIDMEKTADWIMRRAGFGFNFTKDPITQKEWVASSRASLKEPKLYIKDHRFKELVNNPFLNRTSNPLECSGARWIKNSTHLTCYAIDHILHNQDNIKHLNHSQ